jgi:hypothetical protein
MTCKAVFINTRGEYKNHKSPVVFVCWPIFVGKLAKLIMWILGQRCIEEIESSNKASY